jgi:uncharacterized RDD family membrane protein YckC
MGPAGSGFYPGPLDDHGRPLAEWWQRVVALMIDAAILIVPGLILTLAASSKLLGGILYLAMNSAYYGLLNGGDKGQTVGKRVLKIQVREATSGGPLGPDKAVVRYLVDGLATFFSPLLLFNFLDGLWPLWDPKRQALHDKVVNSVVIKTEA